MSTIGQDLELDHHAIDSDLAAYADSLSAGDADVAALGRAAAALRHHIWVEETLHFPPLRAAGLMGPILVMLKEHGQLWDLLRRLEATPDDATTWASVAEILHAHNAKEEQILYPSGDHILSPEQTAAFREALQHGVMPSDWAAEMSGR